MPLTGDARLPWAGRFLGEARAKFIGSDGDPIGFIIAAVETIADGSVSSSILIQGPGDVAAIGLGNGVISCNGPKPGDEKAEPGESDPMF